MTRILYANYFSWHNNSSLGGHQVGGFGRAFDVNLVDLRSLASAALDNGSIMASKGLFVGMIIHVSANNAANGFTRYKVIKRSFLADYATDQEITKIDIPFGETGCFYSDPDIAESTRSYLEFDLIELQITNEDGQNAGNGTQGTTVLMGWETKTGSKSGPHEANFNF